MYRQSEGDLRVCKCVSAPALEKLRKYGLVAFNTMDGTDLYFNIACTQARIDKWLRELFPLLFEFLDGRYPENVAPGYHWILLAKAQRDLYVMDRPNITGAELDVAKGQAARKWLEHAVRIGKFQVRTEELLTHDRA